MRHLIRFPRGRWVVALLLVFLLAACDQRQPVTAVTFPTITLVPTLTMFPTDTPFVPIPQTGDGPFVPGLPPLAGDATPIPVPTRYDPLSPTLTAIAGQPTPTFPPAPPSGPTATAIPTEQMTGGVLGLAPSTQGLWAIRADGSRAALLTSDPILHVLPSPGGTMAAYISNPDPTNQIYDKPYGYALKVITLYSDQVYNILSLTRPGLARTSPQRDLDAAFQTLRAYDSGGLAWSPDGRTLAFVSSHESAAGDVYLYTPTTGSLRRLTQLNLPKGPGYATNLAWSLDGQRVYYTVVYSFGAGGGDWIAGAWVSPLDGPAVQMAPAEQSAAENLVAWLPGTAALMSSWSPDCGDQNLRRVNLRTGETTVLWAGCYATMRYDRVYREVVLSVTEQLAVPDKNPVGTYHISLVNNRVDKLTDQAFSKIYNGNVRAAWLGYNPGQGMFTITRGGQVAPLFGGAGFDGTTAPPPNPLAPLPGSTGWLFTNSQGQLLVAEPGQPPRPLINTPVQNLISSPSYNGLYFFSAPDTKGLYHLYGVRTRDWQPFEVDPRIQNPQGLVWTR